MKPSKIQRLSAIACLCGALVSIAGCAVNPATGRSDLIVVSEGRERSIGRREHPKIVKEFGGVYEDSEVSAYVAVMGGRLAAASERPDIAFTFTVLDSPIVNAFTTPGGFVYVTRGLIALADSEAQLASVVGHELGHAVARHSAQRLSQATLAQLGLTILGQVANTPSLSDVAGRLASLYLSAFSREHEFEADMLGIRYLARAGYDPQASSEFLAKLRAHSRLQARLAGRAPDSVDRFDISATHPRTVERTERAILAANVAAVTDPYVGRTEHLSNIDGMTYGCSADEGFILGQRFAHPELRFEFLVPKGFMLSNQPARVVARSESSRTTIIFDQAPENHVGEMATYLDRTWISNARVADLERIFINGMEAATGWIEQRSNQGPIRIRFVAIRFSPRIIYRFVLITPSRPPLALAEALKRTTYSFRRLSRTEAATLSEKRISVVQIGVGDTVEVLARRMAFPDFRRERFEVLNGLSKGKSPFVGESVKLITQ